MELNEREKDLLRRGLDKASSDSEAQTAAKKLFDSLRERGIDGYQVLEMLMREKEATTRPEPAKPAGPETAKPSSQTESAKTERRGWGVGPGYWSKNPDGSTRWIDDQGRIYPSPPNPRMPPGVRAANIRRAQEANERIRGEQKRREFEQQQLEKMMRKLRGLWPF